ncbi:MAG: glutathione S-transferase family protein [Myxococcota bacterium]
MKLYDSLGPNPRLVRMFMLEKNIQIPAEQVDIMGGANRKAPYTDKNPAGQMPSLELDNGFVLGETIAICEYLEEKHPKPALVGASPEERAETRMWLRRIELGITEPAANGFRFAEGLAMFKDRLHTIPEAASGLKAMSQVYLKKLDGLLGSKQFVCGNRFTLADIALYCGLDFFAGVGQPRDPALKNIAGWFERIAKRPSAEASLHPVAKAGGMRG